MTRPPDPAFEDWLDRQLAHSARAMLASVSPLSIVKHRPGFGQTVTPIAGAIVASPVLADWDPEPDYFFHWFRDSAVVIDALRLLHDDGHVGDEALRHVRDFARFSLALNRLDGRTVAADTGRRARVAPDFVQYLRDDGDLARVHGDAVAAETRVNADGTLDISRWARPQHDGPPLRALAMMRWAACPKLDAAALADVAALIRFDLEFTLRHWREPSYDIWEEESGHHYYTLRVAAAALAAGAPWLERHGEAAIAQRCRDESRAVLRMLDGFWTRASTGDGTPAHGYYRSRMLADGRPGAKELDIAVILSAIHSFESDCLESDRFGSDRFGSDRSGPDPAHGFADPRMHATLARLDALFDAAYPINHGTIDHGTIDHGTIDHGTIDHGTIDHGTIDCARISRATTHHAAPNVPVGGLRPAARGTAMGRYAGDVYFSGGAYYFSTLGAAEFCFRAAAVTGEPQSWFERGDAYLATVRAYTPASGDLSEQFDQRSGAQTSARHLAWSYAAFISCARARRDAAAACAGSPPR